jgi:hypothetical protein
MQMLDVSNTIILRVNYRTPVFVLSASLASVSVLLFASKISDRNFWLVVWLVVVLGALLFVFIIAWTFNFLKLTHVGFSAPMHGLWRMFTKWSHVRRFDPFEKRILGIRCSGVGFNYADPTITKVSRNLFGYNRTIFGTYGGMESPELARFLDQWRVSYANNFATSDHDI